MSSPNRRPRSGLAQLRAQLSERDVRILLFICEHRFITTRQLARLLSLEFGNSRSALRQTHRHLARLDRLEVITSLERRIGGNRAGSSGFIWSITTLGARIVTDQTAGKRLRYREDQPSTTFLEHTLAVAELRVRLHELEQDGRISVESLQTEPDCWRAYLGAMGSIIRLKPDLAATTATIDGYEDYWFFEIDLATENPARIVSKCQQYQAYRRTGTEQAQTGLFPAVVWVTPDEKRATQLRRRLSAESSIDQDLFTVICVNNFETLVLNGAAQQNPDQPGPDDKDPAPSHRL